ncbi:MAG: hypothetical protein SPF56_08860 [Bacteroidaceae bacterium]|nr:hypothetical protein [Bacteroidaceae bacterium]
MPNNKQGMSVRYGACLASCLASCDHHPRLRVPHPVKSILRP